MLLFKVMKVHTRNQLSLGGAITVECRIFVDNELIYPDHERS
ncbi:hypothetical protein G3A_14610 [Bacillus sp. 17376]|nr:hypothetical protein [Mesobacillus boroniphilus]ESU31798.1 hypothetical protein G3A_14610 [Bacillus sp. 17376]